MFEFYSMSVYLIPFTLIQFVKCSTLWKDLNYLNQNDFFDIVYLMNIQEVKI
jgi:hypothetical protein